MTNRSRKGVLPSLPPLRNRSHIPPEIPCYLLRTDKVHCAALELPGPVELAALRSNALLPGNRRSEAMRQATASRAVAFRGRV